MTADDGIVLKTSARRDDTTPADLEASDEAADRINAWRIGKDGKVIGLTPYPYGQPANFAHNVARLRQEAVTIQRPTPLPVNMSASEVTITEEA